MAHTRAFLFLQLKPNPPGSFNKTELSKDPSKALKFELRRPSQQQK